jgi:hypothetical protein
MARMTEESVNLLIRGRMTELGWTGYRLAQAVEGKATQKTVYNLLAGKPVSAASLLIVLDALGVQMTLTPLPAARETTMTDFTEDSE